MNETNTKDGHNQSFAEKLAGTIYVLVMLVAFPIGVGFAAWAAMRMFLDTFGH